MASIESWTKYESPSPSDLTFNDDLVRFCTQEQSELLVCDQSPGYAFDCTSELVSDSFDPLCPVMLHNSSWPSPAVDDIHYQEACPFPFGEQVLFSGGLWKLDQTQNATTSPKAKGDDHDRNETNRAERTRGSDSQTIKCLECGQAFDNLQLLEQHTIKEFHKVWKCLDKNCGKAYPRRDSLARHQLKHSAKGHPCTVCQQDDRRKVFKRKDHLAEHIRKRHSPSTDHGNIKKHEAMHDIVKILGTVLGEGHHKLQGLESTMTALSNSKMESVAETIAEGIAQAAADHDSSKRAELKSEVCSVL